MRLKKISKTNNRNEEQSQKKLDTNTQKILKIYMIQQCPTFIHSIQDDKDKISQTNWEITKMVQKYYHITQNCNTDQITLSHKHKDQRLHVKKSFIYLFAQHPQVDLSLTQTEKTKSHKNTSSSFQVFGVTSKVFQPNHQNWWLSH